MKSVSTAVLAVLLATPAWAGPVELVPHRAVYDLSLVGDGVRMSDQSTTMTGRMVYEFTGGSCEGFTVNFRFVVETTDGDGSASVTDLRTSNHEEADGSAFQFLSQTYTNEVLTEDVKGTAARSEDGRVTVDLDAGEPSTVALDGRAVFPTDHLNRIIAAARAGERVLEQDVYDGSDGGARAYRTTTIIGAELTEPEGGATEAFAAVRRWPVTVAYFDPKAGGDQTPEYSIAFHLWENGVSSDMTMDYGDFALKGDLAGYEPLPPSDCD